MKGKRGFEMTLNFIVMAAIALIVLIVLIAIFTGRVRLFNKNLDPCEGQGGSSASAKPCSYDKDQQCCSEGYYKVLVANTDKDKAAKDPFITCCVPFNPPATK